MHVRPFTPADTDAIVRLFRETIRSINRRDYSADQIAAWAPGVIDPINWRERLLANETKIAVEDDVVVGFAELEATGRIHMLFVHKDRQSRGIASKLLQAIESNAQRRDLDHLHTDASITARPFFESRGYVLVRPQVVHLRGCAFRNYRMEKWLAVGAGSA